MIRLLLSLFLLAIAAGADAATLRERLTPDVLAVVMPGAERLGPEEGSPPSIAVYKGNEVVAYLFSTLDVVRASGYSSVPFDVIAGVDLAGRITGAKVIFHAEPYVVNDAIRQPQLDTFLAREAGTSIRGGAAPALHPDFVAGATVTARAMRGAVADAARLVLRTRLALPQVSEPTLNREQYRGISWNDLLAEGAVVHRRVATPAGETDLYAALFTPAAIGANLIGLNRYNEYMRRFPPGTQVIAVASSGAYDFLGDDYVRAEKGYRFDRIRVRQGGNLFHFVNADFLRLDTRASEGFLSQQYAAIFALPPTFDPLKEWQLELIAFTTAGSEAELPAGLPSAGRLRADAREAGRAGLGRGVARCAHQHRDPVRRAARPHVDLRVSGSARAIAARAPARAHRLSALRAGLARMDRRRPALDHQRDALGHGAAARLRHGAAARAADPHHRASTRSSRCS